MGFSYILISIGYEFLSQQVSQNEDKVTFQNNKFFLLFVIFLTECLIIIVYLIQMYLNKSKKKNHKKSKQIISVKTKCKVFQTFQFIHTYC